MRIDAVVEKVYKSFVSLEYKNKDGAILTLEVEINEVTKLWKSGDCVVVNFKMVEC